MTAASTDLIVRPAHLQLVLHCADRTLSAYIEQGQVPKPDGRGLGGLKLWRLSTLRAWNPTLTEAIDDLLKHPAFAPRSTCVLTLQPATKTRQGRAGARFPDPYHWPDSR